MKKRFVLKDQDGNYVASHSINYNESTKQVSYSCSNFLTNGFYYSSSPKGAEVQLDKLNQLQARFQLEGKSFRIEEIDKTETLYKEAQTHRPKDPFKYTYFDFKDNKKYVWVIKDSQGNLVGSKTFKQLFKAELALDGLKFENRSELHLEYIDTTHVLKKLVA